MKTTDMIKQLCEQNNVSIAELARRIGQSPQNFGKKLKRNTVSQEELNQIAKALGVTYDQTFISGNNEITDLNSGSHTQALVDNFLENEIGIKVQSFDDERSLDDDEYIKLDDSTFDKINALLQNLPHYAEEIKIKNISSDTYRVIYDKGLGQLQQSANNRNRFRSNIVKFGTNNDITGQAELERFQIKFSSSALAIFDIAAIITNQYYLARIDNKLVSLDSKLNYIQKYLEESKKSDLWANGQMLRDISGKIYEISQNEQYRIATLTNIQGIRRDALSNVKFYHKMMSECVKSGFDKKQKDFSKTEEALNHFWDCSDAYYYSVYVYGFAYVIEVALSQITDETFLNKVKDEIQNVINSYQNDFEKEQKVFLNSVKSLNASTLTQLASKVDWRMHASTAAMGIIPELFLAGINITANYDKTKKESQKKELEKQCNNHNQQTKKNKSEIDFPIYAIDKMNDIYNKPVELVVKKGSVYIKLSNDEKQT